jgi:phenylalanyl-tRNA synthetase beta chain
MKIPFSHLNTYFNRELPNVDVVTNAFTFGAFEIEDIEEIAGEQVVDVKVLPNRAHDCLSWSGLARELGGLLDIPVHKKLLPELLQTHGDSVSVKVENTQLSPVYIAAHITNVTVSDSPTHVQKMLEAIGQKSINNLVDATNLAMFEIGSPLHVFDADLFKKNNDGKIAIGVRAARSGEKMTLLGGKEVELTSDMTVITDAVSDEPIALAGVKGGIAREVTNQTKNIIVEAAKFDPALTRKTAQALSIRTDASKRFENEIPHDMPNYGLAACVEYILSNFQSSSSNDNGTVVSIVEVTTQKSNPAPVSVSVEKVNTVLGTQLTGIEMQTILNRVQLPSEINDGVLTITPPWWRLDIEIPEDIIEEVGRVHGYDHIAPIPLPASPLSILPNTQFLLQDALRSVLYQLGYVEVQTYSLQDSGDIQLKNALAEDKQYLRKNLSRGVRGALDKNEQNAAFFGEYDAIKIFEIGHTFTGTLENSVEEVHLCIGVRPLGAKKKDTRTNDLLAQAIAALKASIPSLCDGTRDVDTHEFSLQPIIESGIEMKESPLPVVRSDMQYTPLSPFPGMLRDIAFWSGGGSDAEYRAIITSLGTELLSRIDLFDTFTKEGKTSYAYHIIFQSYERTLTDVEIADIMKKIEAELTKKGCTIR